MGKICRLNGQPHPLIRTAALAAIFAFGSAVAQPDIVPEAASGTRPLQTAHARQFIAVTANPYATDAAYAMLACGGSAVDAAIAAQLVLGLVEPQSSGIGGGGFLVHWQQQQQLLQTFDGRETAPADVDENYFLDRAGKPIGFYDALVGGYAVGTPGLLDMLYRAHREHGKLDWAELFQPAITLAEQGFSVSPRLHALLMELQKTPKGVSHSALREYFYDHQGKPRPVGYPLKNPAYAATLRLLATEGIEPFYRGQLAASIADAVQHDPIQPGKLSRNDLENYRSIERKPLCKQVSAYKLCGMPPPSSGPATVISIISMLDQLPGYRGYAYNSVAFYHRLAEASKLAFADRNRYLADPDFVPQPLTQLLTGDYLQQRAMQITLNKASLNPAQAGNINHQSAMLAAVSPELPSTSQLSIIDAEGNIVSMTSSIETAFGSRIMVGGFLLNNQLTDFSFTPVDAEQHQIANRIEAGKRPRSSMAPMIVFDETNQPVLVVGSPGGARIIDYVAQTIMQILYQGADADASLSSAHVTNTNAQTVVESGFDALAENLKQLGHEVSIQPQTSGIHLIEINNNGYWGVADPRREGSARGE